jgi:hypothetical protein
MHRCKRLELPFAHSTSVVLKSRRSASTSWSLAEFSFMLFTRRSVDLLNLRSRPYYSRAKANSHFLEGSKSFFHLIVRGCSASVSPLLICKHLSNRVPLLQEVEAIITAFAEPPNRSLTAQNKPRYQIKPGN